MMEQSEYMDNLAALVQENEDLKEEAKYQRKEQAHTEQLLRHAESALGHLEYGIMEYQRIRRNIEDAYNASKEGV